VVCPNSYIIYTGGDEKCIRVFDAPSTVVSGLDKLCGYSQVQVSAITGTTGVMGEDGEQGGEQGGDKGSDKGSDKGGVGDRVAKAYIPELSLTNKAHETMSEQERREQEARCVASVDDWAEPPLEVTFGPCNLLYARVH
jgi:hypothetical protein